VVQQLLWQPHQLGDGSLLQPQLLHSPGDQLLLLLPMQHTLGEWQAHPLPRHLLHMARLVP
jgi:hypothetical protein